MEEVVCVHILTGIEPGRTIGEAANGESLCALGVEQAARCVLQGVTFLVWAPAYEVWPLVWMA